MRKTWAIIRRELIAYFSSPLAYIVMTAFLLMQGYIFYLIVSFLNNPQTPAMTPLRLFFGGTIFFWLFLLVRGAGDHHAAVGRRAPVGDDRGPA